MRRSHSTPTRLQLLAVAVCFLTVTVMLAPLRSGPSDMLTRHASFIPFLAASGVAESGAFQRISTARPANACAEPQVRQPDAGETLPDPTAH